jgi:hypothetical protein
MTIILRFVDSGVFAVAEMLTERAPETCRLIWEALPLEGRTIHGMYSGPELFIRADHLPPAPSENLAHRAGPGDVGYWRVEAGKYHNSPGQAAEIVWIYGRGAAVMGPDGQPSWIHLFAQIRPEGAEAFYEECRRVRWEGPRLLRIDRGDGGF